MCLQFKYFNDVKCNLCYQWNDAHGRSSKEEDGGRSSAQEWGDMPLPVPELVLVSETRQELKQSAETALINWAAASVASSSAHQYWKGRELITTTGPTKATRTFSAQAEFSQSHQLLPLNSSESCAMQCRWGTAQCSLQWELSLIEPEPCPHLPSVSDVAEMCCPCRALLCLSAGSSHLNLILEAI